MEYLKKRELAQLLGVSMRSIDRYRAAGIDLGAVRLGPRTVRFNVARAQRQLERLRTR